MITPDFINQVSKVANWKAGANKGSTVDGITFSQAKKLMGVKRNGFKLQEQVDIFSFSEVDHSFLFQTEFKYTTIPTNWTAMAEWPHCPSIGTILDQSACMSR